MTALSSEVRSVLLPEARRLGYAAPVLTGKNHLLWSHASGIEVVTGARCQGRAISNARAQLRRYARVDRRPSGQSVRGSLSRD